MNAFPWARERVVVRPSLSVVPRRTEQAEPAIARQRTAEQLRALVVGAGEAGRALVRDLRLTPEFGLDPVGFIDDTPPPEAHAVLPVLGSTDELVAVANAHRVDVVIVAIPRLDGHRFALIAEQARSIGLSVRYLPSFVAALQRDVVGSDVRDLDLHALIGRSEMHVTSREAGAMLTGRRVLVTGAGGSIGSELCRQVQGFGPSRLFLLDHDESNIHRLQLELYGEALLDSDDILIADIRDTDRIHQVFRDLRPEIVFHAAAHKHLPLLERCPAEAVKSNVLGTDNLVRAATEHDVARFVLISTDKAADPVSILGASKRLAEILLHRETRGPTVFTSVRFGNVLGSRGSLLTILAEQMRRGEPVTVTHPDVSRFFMTIEEAVGLVIEAAHLARGGETFVLDMGEPVRILDLVRNYADQLHLPEVQMRYTGLRPGEKLDEVLFSEHEQVVPTRHGRIFQTCAPERVRGFDSALRDCYEAARGNRADEVRRALGRLVPTYRPPADAGLPVLPAPYPDGF